MKNLELALIKNQVRFKQVSGVSHTILRGEISRWTTTRDALPFGNSSHLVDQSLKKPGFLPSCTSALAVCLMSD